MTSVLIKCQYRGAVEILVEIIISLSLLLTPLLLALLSL
jgi:hypothetical protein